MASTSSSDPGFKVGVGGGETSETVMAANNQLLLYRGLKKARKERGCTAKERISKMDPCTAGKRSSIYRGVTRHRWTGRYEAHLWDKSTWNQNRNKKGKQVYLGAYDDEEAAARAYDLAALKYWGPGTLINFPVTDYTRDLEEMQYVSREDFLASLRRKSSGFSRGIAKYRGLSSRPAGSEYFNSGHYGDDLATESEFLGGFCVDRKIDLTPYIKWWGTKNMCQQESEETEHACTDSLNSELKASDWAVPPTEPYQMPRLGASPQGKTHKGSSFSAMSILLQSAAYKSLQEKASKKEECRTVNDENENKNIINMNVRGKAAETSVSHDMGSDRLGATLGMGGGMSQQGNVFPSTPFLSAPLLTNYNTIDLLADPSLWTTLLPVHPTGPSCASEFTKMEASLTNATLFQPERGTEHTTQTPFRS